MVWQEPILLYFATDISENLFAKEARPIYYAETTLKEIDSDGGKILSLLSEDLFKAS